MVELAPLADDGQFQTGFAGDTMNTAWYLRKLLGPGHQVDYLSAVGQDALSDQMVDFLANAGIGTDHLYRHPDRTVGLYMIQLQDGERSFSYWRGQSAARMLAHDEAHLTRALVGADIAFFSGITLAILSAEDRTRLLAALQAHRARGGLVVFDPNLRPRLWDSADEMTSSIMDAARVSDSVLPSHEDEATWFHDSDPDATLRRYLEAGVGTVVVKNGPGEILMCEKGQISRLAPTPAIQVIDTTAAGDSFNAGYLAGRVNGAPLKTAVAQGAALAAQVIQARGALVAALDK